MGKRVLLMYISHNSGHHKACLSIENALHAENGNIETMCINSFHYTNPILEKIINRTYMTVIKNRPEVWEYLYDNPAIVKKTQKLKESIHKFNSKKMKALLDGFKPDCVVCTQAFPCGIIADLKKTHNIKLPLVGILTDYAPHSYWVYGNVEAYIVPSAETGNRLIENGVSREKVIPFGIPVDPKFERRLNKERLLNKYSLDSQRPVILIMGGGQGLGPIKNLVFELNKTALDIQIIVITGTNNRLYKYLKKKVKSLRKIVMIFSFSENIDELMEVSTLILTKPGGITTAEALVKRLPMVIVNPLPGQEAMNTRFLLERHLAVKADDERGAVHLIEKLLNDPLKLDNIKELITNHSMPNASVNIAKLILRLAS